MAQTFFEGQVVNRATEATIPGVTVKLIKENRATSTNSRGYYKLISPLTLPADTLLFTSIGYKPLRLAVSAYQPNMFIAMDESTTQLKGVTVTDKVIPKPVLHRFALADIKEIRYESAYQNRTWPYAARYMVAMQIKAKRKQVRIASVNIGRREYDENYWPNGSRALPSPYTRFLVHVMTVNDTTGAPGKKLYTKEANLSDNSQMIVVDVTEDDWTVTGDTFFVAVEWLRLPINEILQLDASNVVHKTTRAGEQKLWGAPMYTIKYQPALVLFEDSRKYNAYGMNEAGKWERLNFDKGRKPRTLAMSATIIDQP